MEVAGLFTVLTRMTELTFIIELTFVITLLIVASLAVLLWLWLQDDATGELRLKASGPASA